jgi:hypothetical protein
MPAASGIADGQIPKNWSLKSERIAPNAARKESLKKQKRHTIDQIIANLRQVDVKLGKGKKVPQA